MLVSVYIRKEDEEKWRKLPKKTEAIHKLLNNAKIKDMVVTETLTNEQLDKLQFPLHAAQREVTVPLAATRLVNGVCKLHGLPLDSRGRCLQKGCKYS